MAKPAILNALNGPLNGSLDGPLDGRLFARGGIQIEPLPFCERMSLRAAPQTLPALNKALGMKLPVRRKASVTAKSMTALWLGPDEWLLIAEPGHALLGKLSADILSTIGAVDVSHRNAAIRVVGEKAANVLNSGCPQDLSLAAFPKDACSRTILGKAEIVLLRKSEIEFRVECWRSFADYVWNFLADAARSA